MDEALLNELCGPTGDAIFAQIQMLGERDPQRAADPLAASAALRKLGYAPHLVSAALTQARLREKATLKLGPFAQRMFFTQDGVEQATRLTVAAHHARRFLSAQITKVADLTCGVGADSMAFAALGLDVLATDIDPLTASIAAQNLLPFPNAQVRCGNGLDTDFAAEQVEGIFADPARRDGTGRRIFSPDHYAPPLDAVWDLRDRVQGVGIKVGPGIPREAVPDGCEAQWVSLDGDVVEAGLWFGSVATRVGLGALVLRTQADGSQLATEYVGSGATTAPHISLSSQLLEFVHEPDGAIIRAGLVADLALDAHGALLDPTIAYFTSSEALVTKPGDAQPLTRAYRVVDAIPYNVKALRAYLKERRVGRVTIKKRGIDVTPEQLRPQLALKGPEEATIILTRVNDAKTAIIVEPSAQ